MANNGVQGAESTALPFKETLRVDADVLPSEDILSRAIRRTTDIVMAVLVLSFTAPLIGVVALLVRWDSPGPAFFFHRRVGQNRRRRRNPNYRGPERRVTPGYGRPYKLVKFRSMYVDARERFPESYVYQHSREELYTLPMKVLLGPRSMVRSDLGTSTAAEDLYTSDPRITRVGYWIRRTSVDELPNFWNVLVGQMSIVGPRPDVAAQLPLYEPQHLRKLDVKPGVTGLPQVMGRGLLTFARTNELDLKYVENSSLLLDWRIIVKTVTEAFKGYGT